MSIYHCGYFLRSFLLTRFFLIAHVALISACAPTRVEKQTDTVKLAAAQELGLTPPLIEINTCTKIQYPAQSRREDEQGNVIAQAFVDTTGKVKKVNIQKSSGFPALDAATRTWLVTCRFHPAIKDGNPIAMWVAVAYQWKLED